MRRALFITVFLIIAASGWVYISPRLAAKRFRDATVRGDVKALNAVVDFPALRAHLKADLRKAVTRHAASRSNGNLLGAAVGAELGGAVSDAAVARLVSPNGLIRLARYGNSQSSASGETMQLLRMGYRTLIEFGVIMGNRRGEEKVTFLFRRSGLSWRLARLDIASLTH